MKYVLWVLTSVFLFPLFKLHAEETPSFKQLNSLFGINIFQDDSLWDDTDSDVADRLGWPMESRTTTQASFRYYPSSEYTVLDTQSYTAVLYSIEGKPTQLSLMFTNKGDYEEFINNDYPSKDQIGRFIDALDDEADEIEDRIKNVLGKSERGKLGKGKRLRERVDRWNWNGHAIMLSVQDEEYVAVRITTEEFADNAGKVARSSDDEIKEILENRVVRRENGDVVVSEIPMADQGPKGYCVPATWERYLRYLNIPADMYVLARAGSSGYGGGTILSVIAEAVEDIARSYNRKLDGVKHSLDADDLADYIDKGLPLMWAVYADSLLYKNTINERSYQRTQVEDWDKWKSYLDKQRDAVETMKGLRQGPHVCMIIGYNEETGEIATSDSWGPEFEERWMTVEEAEAITQGSLQIIKW